MTVPPLLIGESGMQLKFDYWIIWVSVILLWLTLVTQMFASFTIFDFEYIWIFWKNAQLMALLGTATHIFPPRLGWLLHQMLLRGWITPYTLQFLYCDGLYIQEQSS